MPLGQFFYLPWLLFQRRMRPERPGTSLLSRTWSISRQLDISPPPFVAVGLAHHSWTEIGASDWLVRSPVALRAPASVEAQAAKVGPDPVVQSQSGRPGVRMRRGAAVDEGSILPPLESKGYFGHKAARPRFSGLRYQSSLQEPFSHRLHCGKRMFGGSHLSHGRAIGLSALSSSRRLPVRGGHSGRVLPPPTTKGGPALSFFQRGRGIIRAILSKLRVGRCPVVLYCHNPVFVTMKIRSWRGST
jgi:hypothetical protein